MRQHGTRLGLIAALSLITVPVLTAAPAYAADSGGDRPVFGIIVSAIMMLGTLTVLILAYRRNRGR